VKYWINLVLLDEEDRRYFKQTEVVIYRKPWLHIIYKWFLMSISLQIDQMKGKVFG
jgi:hypothetical protein